MRQSREHRLVRLVVPSPCWSRLRIDMAPTFPDEPTEQKPRLVWHWYDLICPFCYVGQDRSAVLERNGLEVVDLGFEIHPETPAAGRYVGTRHGPMFEYIEREARLADLPLRWPDRVANSRRALAAVEWVRREHPERARQLRAALFRAYFADQEDISDEVIILGHAAAVGVPAGALAAGLRDGSAGDLLARSERSGRQLGVRSTPSWLVAGRLVSGLRAREDFAQLAATT